MPSLVTLFLLESTLVSLSGMWNVLPDGFLLLELVKLSFLYIMHINNIKICQLHITFGFFFLKIK